MFAKEHLMRRLLPVLALVSLLIPLLSACAHRQDDDSVPLTYLVFFQTNQADLTQEGSALVQEAAQGIRKLRPQAVEITGFSDPKGSEASNKALSEKRTAVVEKALTELGVDPSILVALPLGKATDQLGPTADRRIEIRLIQDRAEAPGPAVTK
jgi:outer membrane protein OmpA-like peptidoglycan-associated protein